MIHKFRYLSHIVPNDDILKALELMLTGDLIDLPVLDKDGKIIGDLKLSEILFKIIQNND